MKLAPLFLLLAACPGTTPSPNNDQPPRDLGYGAAIVGEVGVQLESRFPTYDGSVPDTFSITPALPAGFLFSPTSGSISGTPMSVSARATYTVTASNALGSTTGTVEIQVDAERIAPNGLSYSNASVSYVRNEAVPPNTASVATGTAPFTFSVSPVLPVGLSLDTTTGTISGTPTAIQPTSSYTVTCTNSRGSTQTIIQIAITATLLPPDITGYTSATVTYQDGVPAPTNSPQLAGGPVASFAIDPTLPSGLTFSTTSGRIAGTPDGIFPQATYEVTATNAAGSDTFDLSITVAAAVIPTGNYGTTEISYVTPGTSIVSLAPTGGTGAGWTYTIDGTSDPFPTGVGPDLNTGVISGAPIGSQLGSNYKVRISNGPSLFVVVDVPITFSAPSGTVAHSVDIQVDGISSACPTISGGSFSAPRLSTIEFTTNASNFWTIDILSNDFSIPKRADATPHLLGLNGATTGSSLTWTGEHTAGGSCATHTITITP